MVLHFAPALLLGAFLSKSELLSHITQRVVEAFGGPLAENRGTLVTVINKLPEYPPAPARYAPGYPPGPPPGPPREPNPADWMVCPPPDRFVMLSGTVAKPCVMGVMENVVLGDPMVIRWDRVRLDTQVTVELSGRDLGTFFAEIVPATGSLNVRQVEEHAGVNGHRVFSMRS